MTSFRETGLHMSTLSKRVCQIKSSKSSHCKSSQKMQADKCWRCTKEFSQKMGRGWCRYGMIGDYLITKQTGAEERIHNLVMVTERRYTLKEYYLAFMNDR